MIYAGSQVPLVLQISDGKSDLSVRSKVLDPSGRVVFEGNLNHVTGGMFVGTIHMPDVEFLVAVYEVSDKDYSRASETFYRMPKEEQVIDFEAMKSQIEEVLRKAEEPMLTGQIFREGKFDEFIEGTVV